LSTPKDKKNEKVSPLFGQNSCALCLFPFCLLDNNEGRLLYLNSCNRDKYAANATDSALAAFFFDRFIL